MALPLAAEGLGILAESVFEQPINPRRAVQMNSGAPTGNLTEAAAFLIHHSIATEY